MKARYLKMICVAGVIVFLLAGCGRKQEAVTTPPVTESEQAAETDAASEEATRPPKGNKPELVIALPKDITGLNPMTSSGTINDNFLVLTHETLFSKRDDGSVTPLLATEGVWVDDTTYELMLRMDVTFSDGTKMTADDVVHTIKTARDLHHGAVAPLLTGILETEAVAENRVRFTCQEKIADMEERLSSIALSVQSKAAYETGMQNPYLIGTGRYVFADRVNGRYTTFKLNDLYWGTAPGVSKRISFYAIPDEEARASAVLTGSVDVALLSGEDILTRFDNETSVLLYEPGFSEYRIVYRRATHIPVFYENIPMPWGETYVILE